MSLETKETNLKVVNIKKSYKGTPAINGVSFTVNKGDTLWTIAQEYKADNKDIRQYIYELKKINNITNSNIYDGKTLKIIKEQ